MPTNRELELDRLKKLDTMNDKIDTLMDLLKVVYINTQVNTVAKPKRKVNAGKNSKDS